MKLFWAVLLMGGISWGQSSPSSEEICLMDHNPAYCNMVAMGQTSEGTYCTIFDQDTHKCLHWAVPNDPKVLHNGPVVVGAAHLDGFDVKPLKCGKYQHVEPDYCVQKTLGSGCGKIIPAHCEDTMHVVTEKEWQELLARVAQAEAYRKAGLSAAHIAEQCLHDLDACTDRNDRVRKMIQNLQNDIKTGVKP